LLNVLLNLSCPHCLSATAPTPTTRIDWLNPAVCPLPNSKPEIRKQDQLFIAALNNRLFRASRALNPPFFDAQARTPFFALGGGCFASCFGVGLFLHLFLGCVFGVRAGAFGCWLSAFGFSNRA
jgi:hypothetical protein